MKIKSCWLYKLPLLAVISFSGCTLLKARPAEDSGFLPHSKLLSPSTDRTPFHVSYVPNGERLDALKWQYDEIYIAPVVTSFAEQKIKQRMKSESFTKTRIEDIRELGQYFENKVKQAFEEFEASDVAVDDDGPVKLMPKKYKIVQQPTDRCLVWELALIEVSPNSPELAVAATAASFFVPGTGSIRALGTGSVAMEGIVRDGKTGDVLAEFRDREGDKTAAVSIRDYQQYAHIRTALDDWAEQFAELAATPRTHQVEDSSPFTWKFW